MDLRPLETINFFSWWTHFGLCTCKLHSRRSKVFSLKSFGPFANLAHCQFHFPHISICYICLRFQPPWPQVWFPRRARPSLCLGSQTSLCTWDHQTPNTLCVRVQIPFWSRKLVHKYKAPQTQSELLYLDLNNLHWIRHTKDRLCPKFPLFTFRQKSFFNESGPM